MKLIEIKVDNQIILGKSIFINQGKIFIDGKEIKKSPETIYFPGESTQTFNSIKFT